jgi:hypothetical protein
VFLKASTAAAILAMIAAVAGCASSGSTQATPTATVTVTTTAPAAEGTSSPAPGTSQSPAVIGPAACATSSLRVKQGTSSGYAGGVYVVIDFTNTSGTSCSLYGYPGVSLVSGSSRTQIGLAAKRTATTPVRLVTLAPGATANAVLQIVDALNFPSSTCGPAKATDLQVYPPNQTVPFYLPNTSNGCTKPVQALFISAVQAGAGSLSSPR